METVSEGNPSIIQSLIKSGSPNVLLTEQSSLIGSSFELMTLFQ